VINDSDLERYSRQILVPGIDLEGQSALAAASVCVVGCGGLGNPAALYLAAAGVGRLTLVDDDTVALSNLPRQIAFGEADVGRSKVAVLAEQIASRNSTVRCETVAERLNTDNAPSLLEGVSVVVDGTDNAHSRQVIDAASAARGLPWVMGGAVQMSGLNAVFDAKREFGCLRCLDDHPSVLEPDGDCARLGIVGGVVAAVALTQVNQVIKLITGAGRLSYGELWLRDFREDQEQRLRFTPKSDCPRCLAP